MKENNYISVPRPGRKINFKDFIKKYPDAELILADPEKKYEDILSNLNDKGLFLGLKNNKTDINLENIFMPPKIL